MHAIASTSRRPRFRRAALPPPFRLTDDDLTIFGMLAHHRFLRSTHIALLVGRSIDRTNDRLHKLFHAGYVDRPRAQLDYYPTAGSAPMVYALADRGARLLAERGGFEPARVEWSRRNREAGRPFIEHQLEIMDFYVALQAALHGREDVCLIPPDELVAEFPDQTAADGHPFRLASRITANGVWHEIGVEPDLAFGLRFPDGSRRCFLVEIDRGTMPVSRADIRQTSFERKMRAYLSACAAKQHERRFGWKTFRVLTVTTDDHRLSSMQTSLRAIQVRHSPGPGLFLFATRDDLAGIDPIALRWRDGSGRPVSLT